MDFKWVLGQPYTGGCILIVGNISKPLENMNKNFIHDISVNS